MATDFTTIRALDWAIKLGGPGEVVTDADDVAQCIDIITSTPLGSDPMRPDFGTEAFDFIDAPGLTAVPAMKRATVVAVTRWEARAQSLAITHLFTGGGSAVTLTLSWQTASGATGQAQVTYGVG
jgi:phage baseplate assembly protein W